MFALHGDVHYRTMNSHEYESCRIYAVTNKFSITECHLWIKGQVRPYNLFIAVHYVEKWFLWSTALNSVSEVHLFINLFCTPY